MERQALEFQLGQDLVKIADWCNKNGLAGQVPATYELKVNRDLDRQYLFLPVADAMPAPDQQAGNLKGWQEKINAAKVAHAQRIFELAKRALDQDAPAIAYQLLYEVAITIAITLKPVESLATNPKTVLGMWPPTLPQPELQARSTIF